MLAQDAPHLNEYLDMHCLGWLAAAIQFTALQHLRVRLLKQVDTKHGMGVTHLSELLLGEWDVRVRRLFHASPFVRHHRAR